MNTSKKLNAEYPESYHGGERPRTLRRRFWIAFFLILLIIGAVTFFAQRGANSTSIDGAHSTQTYAALATSWKSTEGRSEYTAPFSTPKHWSKDDGTYMVGYGRGQIEPGLYTVTENPEGYVGYFAICHDLMCLPGDGMDVNSIVHGQDYLVIKPDTFAVRLLGLLVEAS